MYLKPIEFTAENLSELTGSISIACWVIVFVPQIYENFYRKSSEGLSLLFIVLWLAGDVFNVVGAMMQHLLLTMIILAAYYTLADIILLIQCLFYGSEEKIDPIHLSPANPISENVLEDVFHEHQPLLNTSNSSPVPLHGSIMERIDEFTNSNNNNNDSASMGNLASINPTPLTGIPEDDINSILKQETSQFTIKDLFIVTTVILGGFLSWYISYCHKSGESISKPELTMNWLAQLFGYVSAILYLGSRIPQILLNYQRKSCEGISFLFFLFAFLGNTTFIFSVLVIAKDTKYLIINAPWLIGSLGTLFMDGVIFLQFFYYKNYKKNIIKSHNGYQSIA